MKFISFILLVVGVAIVFDYNSVEIDSDVESYVDTAIGVVFVVVGLLNIWSLGSSESKIHDAMEEHMKEYHSDE